MRVFFLLLKVTVFLLLLDFAAKNTDNVPVHFFLGVEWQVPLVGVLFIFFVIGSATGLMAGLARIVRQRRALLNLKRELRSRGHPVAAPATAESI